MGVASGIDVRRPTGETPSAIPSAEGNLLGLPWRVKGKGRMRIALCLVPVLAGSACAGPTLHPETAVGRA
jgi:hypothetical protein